MTAAAEIVTEHHFGPVPLREDRLSFKGLSLPVILRLPQPMSDEELIAFSRENKTFRIERNAQGDLEIMSPVGYDGSKREMFVAAMLYMWAEKHSGICLGSNAGFKLDALSVRSPDAAWISFEREKTLTAEQRRGFAPFSPEFLIEVLSETDSRQRLMSKMEMWIQSGARLAWMIDPYAADVLIYRPGAAPERLDSPDWVEADAAVTGFRLQTSQMWAR